jgi:hypothetical protein
MTHENGKRESERTLEERLLKEISCLSPGAFPADAVDRDAGLLREMERRAPLRRGPLRQLRAVLDSRWAPVLLLLLLALLGWDLARIIAYIFK